MTETWHDDLTRLFLRHREYPATTAERVAYALRHQFVAERSVVVIAQHPETGPVVCGSAECKTLDGPVSQLDASRSSALLSDLECLFKREDWPSRAVNSNLKWWARSDGATVLFALAWSSSDGDRVTLYSRLDNAEQPQKAPSLHENVTAVELFGNAIRGRHQLEYTQKAEDRRAELRERLDSLLHPSGPRTFARLEDLAKLLQDFADSSYLGVRGDLHGQILRLASMVLNRFVQDHVPCDAAVLLSAASSMRRLSEHRQLAEAARRELSLLVSCIDGMRNALNVEQLSLDQLDERQQALSLLAVSLQVYTLASKSTERELTRASLIDVLAAQVRHRLPQLLGAWANQYEADDQAHLARRAPGVRNWLRVWLVLDLIRRNEHEHELDRERIHKPSTMCALALVLRDGIRYELYRSTPGFDLDAATFTQMLQDIVVEHVLHKNPSLSDFGLAQHLLSMEASGLGRWHGDGHQAHILDVYITGNFLLDLHVGSVTQPLGELVKASVRLTAPPHGPSGEAQLRAAFALAALFHDAGMLLFPFVSHPEQSKLEESLAIEEARGQVRNQVASIGTALLTQCRASLEHGDFFGDIAAWEPWLLRQQKDQRPEHELLGAWFLCEACKSAGCVPPEIVRAAVRATLLHGAQGMKVDVETDPAAALLIVCDELCDWYPARKLMPSDRRDIGRNLNDNQSIHRSARQGRARILDIKNFWWRVEDDRFITGVTAPSSQGSSLTNGWPGKTAYWPCFELTLRDPSELDVAVLEVWLRGAQNLGRIHCGKRGFLPALRVTSAIPDRLSKLEQTTRRLLLALKDKLDPAISIGPWLANKELFTVNEAHQTEAVYLVAGVELGVKDHVVIHTERILSTAEEILGDRRLSTRRA